MDSRLDNLLEEIINRPKSEENIYFFYHLLALARTLIKKFVNFENYENTFNNQKIYFYTNLLLQTG